MTAIASVHDGVLHGAYMLGYCTVYAWLLRGCMVGEESAQNNIEYTHLARSAHTRRNLGCGEEEARRNMYKGIMHNDTTHTQVSK